MGEQRESAGVRGSEVGTLAEALDGNAAEVMDEDDDVVGETEEQLAAAAEAQARRRARLDAILARKDWSAERDPEVLRAALGEILTEIRGGTRENAQMDVSEDAKMGTNTTEDDGKDADDAGAPLSSSDSALVLNGRSAEAEVHPTERRKNQNANEDYAERSRYIPVRLSAEERATLRLAQAALDVSDYTGEVDVLFASRTARRARQIAQLRAICAVLLGLRVAADYAQSSALADSRDFAAHADFFRTVFEVARRHKVANPERMRSDYGKLMHLLQDAASEPLRALLGFDAVARVRTVRAELESALSSCDRTESLLSDPRLPVAVRSVDVHQAGAGDNVNDGDIDRKQPQSVRLSRREIDARIRVKERAVRELVREYSGGDAHIAARLEQCLYSIGDNEAFLMSCCRPCEEMLVELDARFAEDVDSAEASLAIVQGRAGARLTHDHRRQVRFVRQSLMIWREVIRRMFKLWHLADEDFLDVADEARGGCMYALRSTGQGLHRVQAARRVEKEMRAVVRTLQGALGEAWVGSSVVHLGDHNVPNALVFIDKYAQVPRILNPVLRAVRSVRSLCESDVNIQEYVDAAFGGVRRAETMILRDFFRHAFDGSGADNFFDAGSCIDGRLTSAWNWCSRLEKKPFFPLFLLSGFTGFDGAF